MEPDQQPPTATDGTGADHERSGATVAEAVARAESGRPPGQVHQPPEDSAAGSAPVEQHADDPAMTQGRRVEPGAPDGAIGEPASATGASQQVSGDERQTAGLPPPPQTDLQSGAAQSQPGPRVSDLIAAGQPEPDAPPVAGDPSAS